MKKIGITLLTAFVGGAMAVGSYKLIENKYADSKTFEERQKVYFTNNPVSVASSAGDVDFVQPAAAVMPAVVHIKTTYSGNSASEGSMEDVFGDIFGSPRQRTPQRASGSGVIISEDGYIVTNNHVVDKASKIDVVLPDKRSFQAKVIGRDPNTDLALIKVSGTKLPIVKLGNSDNVQVGEWVLAVGYPLSLNTTVTAGIVSAKGRSIGILGQDDDENSYHQRARPVQRKANTAIESFIQTDAAINQGNSGGALVNTRGELIGINSAIASQTGSYAGYGFAIPINLAKKILEDFRKYGVVKRGFIGVSFDELNAENAQAYGVKQINGLYVNKVVPSSGAEAAGLKSGDILTRIEGNEIRASADLQERVGRLRPGDKVQLTYLREGKERTATVTLKGEESVKIASNISSEEIFNKMGASFTPATSAQKQRYNVRNGVIVTEVYENGIFAEADIPKGTVITNINGKLINSVDDMDEALTESRNNMVRIDGIAPDGSRFRTILPIGPQ